MKQDDSMKRDERNEDEREAQRAVDEIFDGIEEPATTPEKPEGE